MKTSTSLCVLAVVAAALLAVAAADKEISGGGVFMKIQGQSGKMTYATSTPVGSAEDRVQVQLVKLDELASDGTVLGAGGSAKHSFNSFATQSFTFGNPSTSTYPGVKVQSKDANTTTWAAHDYAVTTITFDSLLGAGQSTDSKLSVRAIIFNEDAVLEFPNLKADGTVDADKPKLRLKVAKGTLKFNTEFSQWNWCNNNGCKNSDGVGAAIKLTISMTTQAKADAGNVTGGCNPCGNGDVSKMGSGAEMAVVNSYNIVASGGATTSYVLGTAPEVTTVDSGSSVTTTLVITVPRTNFGATDRLVYDPLVTYGSITDADGTDPGGNAAGALFPSVAVALLAAFVSMLATLL